MRYGILILNMGFDGKLCAVECNSKQSNDIIKGVDRAFGQKTRRWSIRVKCLVMQVTKLK